ncbi:MAG: hypothetical protein E7Z76_05465 [Methanobrevibacter sp.]|jgi:hypothetical protein|nr:hypothetical protein [Methanobrevibacter sp.]
MDIKKILLISIIAIAIVASASVVSAGLFDGLFGGEEQQDNVIEIGKITFNTTNATNFTKTNEEKYDDGSIAKYYWSENGTGDSSFSVLDYKNSDKDTITSIQKQLDEYKKMPSQTVNGVIVYTNSYTGGKNVGKPCYMAIVQNTDLKKFCAFISPDPNETAKMVLSLDFN